MTRKKLSTSSNTIFIDECGYTGEDLFTPEQRVFTLASIKLNEGDCKDLKSQFFNKIRARELKHSKVSSRASQQEMVIDFLKHLSKHPEFIKLAVADKRFVLLTKIVDILIETLAYENGIDLYKKGGNIALSNLLFYVTRSVNGAEFFDEMLFSFQEMMRWRTKNSYLRFFSLFLDYEHPEPIDYFFDFLRACHYKWGPSMLKRIPKGVLEIGFSYAFALAGRWSDESETPLVFVHDSSSEMARSRLIWNRIVHPSVPPATVGWDRRKMNFPLKVEKTFFDRSENWAGLQLADILAGSINRCMKWFVAGKPENGEYAKALASFIPEAFRLDVICWPQPKVTPEELGTIGDDAADPHDHFVRLTEDLLE